MKQAKYNMISGMVLTLSAVYFIVTIGFGWTMAVNGVEIPLYVEYSVAALSLVMAYSAFRLLK